MNLISISIIILTIFVIVLCAVVIRQSIRITQLTKGSSAENLESIIKENNKMLHRAHERLDTQADNILNIEKDAISNLQNIGVVRFNPFKETGGSQSFAIAITDKESNGVVISSLYARERVNVYAKPLVKGVSEYTLSEEEKEAITKSLI